MSKTINFSISKSDSNKFIWLLTILVLAINTIGMFFPVSSSTFSPYYGSIAKHIALTNDWYSLVLSNRPWMDKPHLPFWLTAVSFKILGINSFSYILPGFIFYLIGLYYTYRLAKHLFNEQVGLLSVLVTSTSLHLMLSAIDVRAEAYLIGEIMPACFYWLKYDESNSAFNKSQLKNLLLAAFFSALALMTKGLFVLITIISGTIGVWIYQGKWKNFISLKWLGALALIFLLTLPELVALHMQFDVNSQMTVFNDQHISGIRWFFFDSQFGRFFNTGPIVSTNPPPFHYLYFVYTMMWAYLPWWSVFFIALFYTLKDFTSRNFKQKFAIVYLLCAFLITFILFSATTFQVDHYTNILFPFASIIVASFLVNKFSNKAKSSKLLIVTYYIELALSGFLIVATLGASYLFITDFNIQLIFYILIIFTLALFIYIYYKGLNLFYKLLLAPVISMSLFFSNAMVINGVEYVKFDPGYKIATFINQANENSPLPIVAYKMDYLSLEFYTPNQYSTIYSLDEIKDIKLKDTILPFYLVIPKDNLTEALEKLKSLHLQGKVLKEFNGCSIANFLVQGILHHKGYKFGSIDGLTSYKLILVD